VLFAGIDAAGNNGLWMTNGTAAGTFELTGISGANASGVAPFEFAVVNGEALFNGIDAAGHFGLWATNGTAVGTFELNGISGANATDFAPFDFTVLTDNGVTLFNGFDTNDILGLWVTNGTAASGEFADILFFDSHYELERANLLGGLAAIRKRGGGSLFG
jgi:ELWxxDGT repeat protein